MSRYDRWVSRTSRILDILALIFLADVTLNWLITPGPPWWRPTLDVIAWGVWGAFAIDYVVRLSAFARGNDDVLWVYRGVPGSGSWSTLGGQLGDTVAHTGSAGGRIERIWQAFERETHDQTVPLTAINDSPGGSYEWLKGGGDGGRNLDARTLFFYRATLNTPAMMYKMVGAGSQYAGVSTDSDGNVFDGGKAYRLTIPADVPAKNFWSVVVYDTQTRSELQTGQPLPSKEQPARGRGREPGWFGGPLLRACRAGRSGSELDRNGAG